MTNEPTPKGSNPADSHTASPLPVKRLRSEKLNEMVAKELEVMILAGQYGRGQMLPSEREICQTFGVSRSVVRDAMRTLVTKGLVEVQQGVGAMVTGNARQALMDSLHLTLKRGEFSSKDMIEVRHILEVPIAGLAAKNATESDLVEIEGILQRWGDVVGNLPWEESVKFHHEFHLSLIQASHNRVLLALIHPIAELLLISAAPQDPSPSAVQGYLDHRTIFERICAHDVEGAKEAMHHHFLFDLQEEHDH